LRFEQLRKALLEGEDDTAAWTWDSGAFIGWRVNEARAFVERVITRELTRSPMTETLRLDGEQTIELGWGLRIYDEIKELVGALRDLGWQVWINSASPRWEVEPFAARYGFRPERIIGMQREIVDGVLTQTVQPPVCFGDGKLGAYQMCISCTQAPTLVAGDSLGDWKLLESAGEARLLIEPLAASLRTFAEWRKSEGEKWMVQKFSG
jgi:phosphoserine phosphatase